MYKIVAVGGKIINIANSWEKAKELASNFANENCTFVKIYHNDTLVAVYS